MNVCISQCVCFQIQLDRDYQELVNFELRVNGSLEKILIIDKNTGEISVHGKVDYETINHTHNVCAIFSLHENYFKILMSLI